MEKCNEVLGTWDGQAQYVCEHEAGVEHSHADFASYIRPLREDEVVVPGPGGTIFLEGALAVREEG